MAEPRLAVISNRFSSGNGRRLDHVRALLAGFSGAVDHREIEDIAEIPDILGEFARFEPDILVINGGDGTVQAVLTAAMRNEVKKALPPVAIIPGGKTNMIAEDLGAFGESGPVLERYLAALSAGKIRDHLAPRSLIELRLSPDAAPVCGAFFGTGSVVRGIEFVRHRIHPRGWPNWMTHLVAISLLLGAALFRPNGRYSPMRADLAGLTVDDTPYDQQYYFLIMTTTLHRLLLGLRPFPTETNGLKVTAITYSAATILKGLWATVFHRLDKRPPRGMIAREAKRVSIRIDCPVTLDGELFTPSPDVPIELRETDPVTFVRVP